jgi:Fe-S cluster biogenesis protein NfuA
MRGLPRETRRRAFLPRLTPVSITAAVSPTDGRVCAFTLDRPVADGSVLCRNAAEAAGSPLLEGLFAFPAVTQVWVAGERVTVAFAEPPDWAVVAKEVGRAIRAALADGRPPISPHRPAPLPDDLAERVADVLYRRINPGLAQHGGRAELVDVKGGVARVRLSGGCQGCGAAKMTLSLGIEQTLRGEIPELRGVEDVTDHAAGERPYYPGAGGASPFS